MCRMTHGCKCRQADNYELQSCALRPQSGPPPPRKKRLSAMRCSTLPGRRLYERLPERRLKLLATHWPPTPRSRARADTTTVPATATEPEWRSRPSAYYQLEMWRQVKRARSTAGGASLSPTSRVGWGAKAPAPAAAARQSAEPPVASPQVVRLCLREGVCVLFMCAASDKDYMVEERAQRLPQRPVYCSILQYTAVYCSILQYTAVYCSILQYTEIFGIFFLILIF